MGQGVQALGKNLKGSEKNIPNRRVGVSEVKTEALVFEDRK